MIINNEVVLSNAVQEALKTLDEKGSINTNAAIEMIVAAIEVLKVRTETTNKSVAILIERMNALEKVLKEHDELFEILRQHNFFGKSEKKNEQSN